MVVIEYYQFAKGLKMSTSTKKRLNNRDRKFDPASGESLDVPVIDWEEMSIMDAVGMAHRQDEATYLNVLAVKVQTGRATDAEWERFELLRSPEFQIQHLARQAEDMAKYVSSVPRSWFKNSAPESLDFDDPETFKLLQPKRFLQLYQLLLMNDIQAEAVSGN